MRAVIVVVLLILAGCSTKETNPPKAGPEAPAEPEPPLPDNVTVDVQLPDAATNLSTLLTFRSSIVDAGLSLGADLSEPTIDVSDTGVIYVAGHVVAAATTGTPAFVSRDDGASWEPLPFAASMTSPGGQGAAPPPGDEGFIVAGDDGRAWMVDINLAAFPVMGWCDDGRDACAFVPDTHDRAGGAVCGENPTTDRPWAAVANGSLLMVNHRLNQRPEGSPIQVGVMRVPPGPTPDIRWNMCIGEGDVPGTPGLRDDGLFAVPQLVDEEMYVAIGNVDDLTDIEYKPAFDVPGGRDRHWNFGVASFDGNGTLYVAGFVEQENQIAVAMSQDDGATFQTRAFNVPGPIQFFFADGNTQGEGLLVSWGTTDGAGHTWHAAHILPEDGPVMYHASQAGRTEGAYGDVFGSAVGPDGRAYLTAFEGPGLLTTGTTPIRVFIQEDGPTLPVY